MRLKLVRLCLAAALSLALALPAWTADPPREITETKDRLTDEEMEALVAEPLSLARAGDLAGAEAAFRRLLEERRRLHGADSREVSDTLYSWMIVVFNEGTQSGNKAMQELAVRWATPAAAAVRQAWGPDHLEFALVLNDVVQMGHELEGDAVEREAEVLLREAYRIRAARLGETHKETVSTLIYLGNIQGLRSRTGGTVTGAATAVATLKKAIADLERAGVAGKADLPWAYVTLAQVYARNGALEPAMESWRAAQDSAAAQGQDSADLALFMADALKQGGFEAEAKAVMRPLLDKLDVRPPS